MHLAGVLYDVPSGEKVDVPSEDLAKARQNDAVIRGWFDSEEFMVVAGGPEPKAKAEDEAAAKAAAEAKDQDGKPEGKPKK
jgi:hypothetical protein